MKNKQIVFAAVVTIVATLIAILAYAAYNNYEVLDKGQLLPYTHGFIYEILLFDKYRIYVEPEIRLTGDVINTAILLGVAYISVTFATIIYSREKLNSLLHLLFFTILSCGMFYLAADELLGIHESIGHNLQFLMSLPFIKHPDDFIIAFYGVFVLIFTLIFRSVIFGSRRPLIYFGTAILMFMIAAIGDIAGIGKAVGASIEDFAEITAAILILAGTLSIGLAAIENTSIENDELEDC